MNQSYQIWLKNNQEKVEFQLETEEREREGGIQFVLIEKIIFIHIYINYNYSYIDDSIIQSSKSLLLGEQHQYRNTV